MDRAFDNDTSIDELQAEETKEQTDDEDTAPIENVSTQAPKKERKKKNTELENLKIDNWEPPRTAKRTRKRSSLVNSTSAYHCMPLTIGLELKSDKQEERGVGNENNFEEGEVLNENNPVLLMWLNKKNYSYLSIIIVHFCTESWFHQFQTGQCTAIFAHRSYY